MALFVVEQVKRLLNKLTQFSETNVEAIRKIAKKYDKVQKRIHNIPTASDESDESNYHKDFIELGEEKMRNQSEKAAGFKYDLNSVEFLPAQQPHKYNL